MKRDPASDQCVCVFVQTNLQRLTLVQHKKNSLWFLFQMQKKIGILNVWALIEFIDFIENK